MLCKDYILDNLFSGVSFIILNLVGYIFICYLNSKDKKAPITSPESLEKK